jgi:hypothetical protein
METFTPDFVFWRDTGNQTNPQATIFLGESNSGCEKWLVDFPLGELERIQNLKFSSVDDDTGFFGRVVWSSTVVINNYTQDAYVWKMDFTVSGANLDLIDSHPVPVLQNGLLDNPDMDESIFWSLDLSPDTNSLVYAHIVHPDPDHYYQDLRILPDIGACVDAADPCTFDAGYVLDGTGLAESSPFGPYFVFASWAPGGDGIYVQRRILDSDAPYGYVQVIQYYDLLSPDLNHQFFSDPPFVARPVAGKAAGIDYLAVEKEFSVKTGGCEGIFITDLDECLASDGDCFSTPAFAGKFPSWTKDGKLIHAYDGWEPHGGCGLTKVGVWDPSDGSLRAILDGREPNAAGGVR